MKNRLLSFFVAVVVVLAGSVFCDARAETIRVSNFKAEYQGNAPWCWAASARMALYQRAGIRKSTCELVSEVLEKNCCGIFADFSCWVGGKVQNVLSKNGFDTQYLPTATQAVVDVVKSDRVAILGLVSDKPGALGHVSVVYGVENIEQPQKLRFMVYDPALGKIKVKPDEIRRRYELDHRKVLRWAYTMAIAN